MDKEQLVCEHFVNDFKSNNTPLISTQWYKDGIPTLHDHNYYEIVYILSDSICHMVNGIKTEMKHGDIVFLRLKDRHCFIPTSQKKVVHRDILVEKTFFEETCASFSPDLLNIYNKPILPLKIRVPLYQLSYLESLFSSYTYEKAQHTERKHTTAKFILSHLLSLIYFNSGEQKNDKTPVVIQQIVNRMSSSQLYKAGLPVILKELKYDKSYLCRLFKKHLGITMTDYLNEQRLSFVESQLKTTTRSINEICHEAGFSSISYFNRLFLKKYHMTPKEYRKSITPPPRII